MRRGGETAKKGKVVWLTGGRILQKKKGGGKAIFYISAAEDIKRKGKNEGGGVER